MIRQRKRFTLPNDLSGLNIEFAAFSYLRNSHQLGSCLATKPFSNLSHGRIDNRDAVISVRYFRFGLGSWLLFRLFLLVVDKIWGFIPRSFLWCSRHVVMCWELVIAVADVLRTHHGEGFT